MRTTRIKITASLLLVLLATRPSAEQDGPRALAAGQTVERELSAGQTHTYTVTLNAGEFLHVVVVQRGIDVLVELRGPDGHSLIEEDSPLGSAEAEWITYEAAASGAYAIAIRPVDKNAPAGRYSVQVQERRPAGPGDARRISAESVFLDANAAFVKGTPDSYRDALGKYEQAAGLYAQVGRRTEEAVAHDCAAQAARELKDDATVLQHAEQALAIYRALNDVDGQSASARTVGTRQYFAKRYEESRKTLEAALPIDRALRDRDGEARTLTWLGYAYQKLDRDTDAITCFERALAIRRELADKTGIASSLDDLGFDHWLNNRFDKAIDAYEQALPLHHELHERDGEATTLERLGNSYGNTKRLEKAVAAYEQGIVIRRELKDRKAEASALADLAFTHYMLNDYQGAVAAYERALPVQREIDDREGTIKSLEWMARSCRSLGRVDEAIKSYEIVLEMRRAARDRHGELSTLDDIAYTYDQAERYDKSVEFYADVLAMQQAKNDREGQAHALFFLGVGFSHLRQYQKAIQAYEELLALRRELKDAKGEASAIEMLSMVYEDTGERDKAIRLREEALSMRRALEDRGEEVTNLIALARLAAMQDNERATALLEQALAIQRATHDRAGEGRTLNVLGLIQAKSGHYDKELAYYEQALAIARETGNRTNEGLALVTVGSTYMRLGLQDSARTYFEQGLAIGREVHNKTFEIVGNYALGGSAGMQGRYEEALQRFDQVLTLTRAAGDRKNEGDALAFEALIYIRLKQYTKAAPLIEQSLAIARERHDPSSELQALMGQAVLLKESGDPTGAAKALQSALTLAQGTQLREMQEGIFSALMAVYARSQPRLAIVYGKKSINIIQEIRGEIPDLDQTLRQAFLEQKKSRYRELADLLASQGRLAEAQQVLDLQKGDEFRTFVMRDSSVASEKGRVALTAEEIEWETRYTAVADRLTSLGAQRRALLEKPNRTGDDEKVLTRLETDLEAGNRAFQNFLNGVENVLGDRKAASDQVSRVREAEGLMETLRDLGKGSVAVYTILGEQGYRSILITPDVEKGYAYQISAADLNRRILAFRELLRNPASDPRPAAKELYDILVRPMEKDLEGAQAETIMWSLDGALRYMPIAALYDGEHYLVEKYRNVVFTPASQSRLKDPVSVSHDWRGLGVGVSLAHENFAALPNVPNELSAIISSGDGAPKGVVPGTVELDADFTKDGFRSALRNHYTIVHVASHFSFSPGHDHDSFLLMGDGGRLTLEEFRNMPQVLQGVELLTLSACETAVGGEDADGKEIEGLAVLAQRQGAKAVVATLWSVADESTALLMQEFYRLRMSDASMTKAEALRQAQLALLTGRLRGGAAAARGIRPNQPAGVPAFKTDLDRPYAHPYFWAPFLLMGNWK